VVAAMPHHVIQQGECLASLVTAAGLNEQKVWGLPENAGIRLQRKHPHILQPGDIVFIPEKELRHEARPTEQHHRFKRKSTPVYLRVCLLAGGSPIAKEAYVLKIAGKAIEGTTNDAGLLQEFVPADAEEAILQLDRGRLELKLMLGHLNPITEVSGVQARLNNLGYYCGEEERAGPLTRSALQAFQETYQLTVTDVVDDSTRQKLQDKYGC
jgi:N-acetylmuramoyl-L-alanine amidase